MRNICGLTVEPFHQPTALWHASGFYLMAAAAAGQVFVFHVGSCKVRLHALPAQATFRMCRAGRQLSCSWHALVLPVSWCWWRPGLWATTLCLVQVVARLKAQAQKNVRAMDYDKSRNLLVTAGFDRTVNMFMQPSSLLQRA